jgi:hypothetical protein
MDLTLECIRRFYAGGESPLGDTLKRYADFFALFDDFRGYTEFFLLQDLLTGDHSAVRFFMVFGDFRVSSRPRDVEEHRMFRANFIEFIATRSRRIAALAL